MSCDARPPACRVLTGVRGLCIVVDIVRVVEHFARAEGKRKKGAGGTKRAGNLSNAAIYSNS